MSCTAEEIAEKRRVAIERLNARKAQHVTPIPPPVKPKETKEVHSVRSFYSNANEKLKDLQSKIKTNPFNSARAQSQPYSKGMKYGNDVAKLAPIFTTLVSCTCSLISEQRFTVVPSSYSEKLIEVFKQIPSRAYDSITKHWNFGIHDYSLVQERVSALKPDIVIGVIPQFILRYFTGHKKPTPSQICLSAIEPKLVNCLMQFQKEGVCFGIDKNGRALIADEMGLGKTYQALAIADFYKHDWPLLVCTTATTRDVWATKIRELLPTVPCHNIMVLSSTQDYIGEAKILISSYNLMERCSEKLLERNFGFIIMDESHNLKNFKTKCTSVALQLAKVAKRVVLLSGTPALSRPAELFTQLQMLDRSIFTFKEYSTRYCAGKQSNFGWDASGQSNLPELNVLLSRKFMIRRTKSEVMSQLTEKNRETVLLDPSLIWTNEDTEENLSTYASDYSSSTGRNREEILLKFYNVTAEAKRRAVCAYLKGVLKENQKFIVFAHHVVMMNAISECLKKSKVDFIKIDGKTKSSLRSQYVDTFQTKEKCRVAVLSLKACNAGITMTAAQLVIFAELDWNPSTLAQAESRAHRIGQEGTVSVRYLMAKGTADDIIWTMLQKKQDILNKAGLCNEDFSDASNTVASVSAGNIKPYLVQRDASVSSTSMDTTEDTKKEFEDFLNDDDDGDLAGLDF